VVSWPILRGSTVYFQKPFLPSYDLPTQLNPTKFINYIFLFLAAFCFSFIVLNSFLLKLFDYVFLMVLEYLLILADSCV